MKPDPLAEFEVVVQGEKAAALGRAGRKLDHAVGRLAEFDGRGAHDPGERGALRDAAADALWAYVVQRESIGVTDHVRVSEVFGIPGELWRRLGANA